MLNFAKLTGNGAVMTAAVAASGVAPAAVSAASAASAQLTTSSANKNIQHPGFQRGHLLWYRAKMFSTQGSNVVTYRSTSWAGTCLIQTV